MSVWLTHLICNPRHLPQHRATGLIDAHRLHQITMKLVPDDLGATPRARTGLLFRLEATAHGHVLLAQTRVPPRLDALPTDFAHQAQHRDLTPLLDALRPGVRVRYRIAANPTQRHGATAPPHKRGKLHVLRGQAAEGWWLRKASASGLHPLHILSSPAPDVLGSNAARHGVTRFDGIAVVTDPTLLRTAVLDGIGRARTYGCGLLSLAPAEDIA